MNGSPQDRTARLLDRIFHGADEEQDVDTLDDVDLELLAAYAEGNVTLAERVRCEEILAHHPAAVDLVADLWREREQESVREPVQPRREADAAASRAVWYSLAASLLAAVAAGGWAVSQSQTVGELEQQLGSVRGQLQQTQRRLGLLTKERFLAQAPSPFRAYWMGDVTPDILQLPELRGERELSPAGSARAAELQQYLETLAGDSSQSGYASLELAALEIAAGRLPQAEGYLTTARGLLGDDPAVDNLRAVWHLAHADKELAATGEALLMQVTRQHAGFAPAWYNLALYLQQSGRDAESRAAWQEYLRREPRPEYRFVAESALAEIPE